MSGVGSDRKEADMTCPGMTAIVAVIMLVLSVTARAGESVEIKFGFEDGAKSRYDVSLDLDVTNTAEIEGQKVSNSTKTAMKLVLDLRVKETTANAPPELAAKFSGLEVNQTLTGPSGEIKVEIRDRDVKVEKDSRYVVNTEEDLGKDLASGLLAEFGFIGEEGTLVMDRRGHVLEVKGPRKFTAFLAASSGPGLFVLEAPEGAVAAGATWESGGAEIGRLKGLDFSANPLAVKTVFALEGVEEEDGRKIAKITVISTLEETGISARASTEAVKDRYVNIEELTRTAEGTVLFDLDRGVVVESDLDVTFSVKMKIKHEDEEVGHEMTGTARVRSELRATQEPQKEGEDRSSHLRPGPGGEAAE